MLSGLLVLNLACSDDDQETITGTGTPTYDDPVLEAMATEGQVVTQAIMDKVPSWAQGTLGKKAATDPTYDEDCSCWTWTDHQSDESNPAFTWFRNWNFEVTFYQNEVPQQAFEGADRIQAEIVYGYNDIRYSDELNQSNSHLNFNLNLNTTEFNEQSVVVSGSGGGNFAASITQHGETIYHSYPIDLMLYQTIPVDGGCPTGSFDLDTGPASFSIGFDGHPTAHWGYTPRPRPVAGGNPDV